MAKLKETNDKDPRRDHLQYTKGKNGQGIWTGNCRRETQMLKKKRGKWNINFLKYMYIILHSSDSF